MKKKEDLRIIKTKKSLYEGLLIMMKDKPFDEIKVSDICEKALINRSTFYDHFSDKYELLNSLINDLEKELELKLSVDRKIKNTKEYYMNLINLLFDHINENINIYIPIIRNNNNNIAGDIFKNILFDNVLNYITKNNYKGTVPTQIVTSFYVNGVINVCLTYFNDPKKYTKDDILLYLDQLLPNDIG